MIGLSHVASPDETIRIVVADVLGTRRLRVRHELSPQLGFDVVAEAVDAEQALAVTTFTSPDLVLLHPDLPNDDHRNICSELAERCPRTVVLIHPEDHEDLRRSVRNVLHTRIGHRL